MFPYGLLLKRLSSITNNFIPNVANASAYFSSFSECYASALQGN